MEQMRLLEEAVAYVSKYTKNYNRPGLMDLWVYDMLISMHESDYSSVEFMTYIWRKTPDEVMQHIIESGRIFDLEFGWDQLDEEIRDYMLENDFISHVDDVSDEEYQTNLEERQ